MLEFEINDQKMVRVDSYNTVARSQTLQAHFTFKAGQWEPPYFAVFQGLRTDPYTVCLDQENTCTVPWEAMRYGGAMHVSLYSMPAYPTNKVTINISDTGFSGCFPRPSPNIYDQLLFGKADEIQVEGNDVLLRAFGEEISRARLPQSGGGEPGKAATIQVGSVTAGEPGTQPKVTNSGTENAAIFDFVIPKGDQGPAGAAGPQGEKGDAGEQGPAGEAGPAGPTGPQGEPGAGVPDGGIIGQVLAKRSNSNQDTHWIDPPSGGGGGEPGKAATIQVGEVTTGEPGSDAQVTNSGTENAAVFDFVIPRGEQGAQGPKGDPGEQGPAGADGAQGPQGEPGKGIPPGGTAGQFLVKEDGTDYNAHWIDAPPGGGGEGLQHWGEGETSNTVFLKTVGGNASFRIDANTQSDSAKTTLVQGAAGIVLNHVEKSVDLKSDINMKSHKITMLSDGADDTDAATVGQVKQMVGSVGSSTMQLVQSNEYYELYFDGTLCYFIPLKSGYETPQFGSPSSGYGAFNFSKMYRAIINPPRIEQAIYCPKEIVPFPTQLYIEPKRVVTRDMAISKDGSITWDIREYTEEDASQKTGYMVAFPCFYKPSLQESAAVLPEVPSDLENL